MDNVLMTPHVASYTEEGRLKMETEAVENLLRGFGASPSH
jgi:lactate dehydrogenase-like 2-hydroxyacid dehydrogenase